MENLDLLINLTALIAMSVMIGITIFMFLLILYVLVELFDANKGFSLIISIIMTWVIINFMTLFLT